MKEGFFCLILAWLFSFCQSVNFTQAKHISSSILFPSFDSQGKTGFKSSLFDLASARPSIQNRGMNAPKGVKIGSWRIRKS